MIPTTLLRHRKIFALAQTYCEQENRYAGFSEPLSAFTDKKMAESSISVVPWLTKDNYRSVAWTFLSILLLQQSVDEELKRFEAEHGLDREKELEPILTHHLAAEFSATQSSVSKLLARWKENPPPLEVLERVQSDILKAQEKLRKDQLE